MSVRILQGDCRDLLKTLPASSVHMVCTSPPYFGLRDYGVAGQIGLEQSPADYVAQMVEVFREVRRVLRDDGTVFLNLGDSYAANRGYQVTDNKHIDVGNTAASKVPVGLKPKDLIGIPWRVAFALQADGWWLRQDNIWAKRNCMPESVRDRTTRAHEYVFMLTKAATYFYDAVAVEEDGEIAAGTRAAKGSVERAEHANGRPPEYAIYTGKRNKRSVWWMATQPFPEAHFATFPPELPEICIKAGTSERGCCAGCGAPWVRQTEAMKERSDREPRGKAITSPRQDGNPWNEADGRGFLPTTTTTTGWLPSCPCNTGEPIPCTVLDPFAGAFTTALVADRLGRDCIGIELNPEYCEMARRRITKDAGLFAEFAA